MYRTAILAAVIAATPLASAVAAAPAAQAPVVINVVCPNAGGRGPLQVMVNPWAYDRRLGEVSTWQLTINNSGDNSVEIRRKADRPWPFTADSYRGSGRLDVGGDQMSGATGSFEYDIVVYCGSDRVVIDPKMEIGR